MPHPSPLSLTAVPDPIPAVTVLQVDHQKQVVHRLRRIEGQVRGVVEMIQAGRSCEEVALQLSAARKALDKAFYSMMASAMIEAAGSGNGAPQAAQRIEETARLLEKFG